MKALFRKSSSSLEHLKRAARGDSRGEPSGGDIAWMVVGGVLVVGGLILLIQEIPAIVREVRIMRM